MVVMQKVQRSSQHLRPNKGLHATAAAPGS